ncbi:MAG: hypothetical protein EAZ16_12710 [Sphingobacteriales bacterium]|nr:MAG: hypothetical protein EAZ16_12710 [Sphingobacteriales bacterium]
MQQFFLEGGQRWAIQQPLRRTLVPHNKIEHFCGTPQQAVIQYNFLCSYFIAAGHKEKVKTISLHSPLSNVDFFCPCKTALQFTAITVAKRGVPY